MTQEDYAVQELIAAKGLLASAEGLIKALNRVTPLHCLAEFLKEAEAFRTRSIFVSIQAERERSAA